MTERFPTAVVCSCPSSRPHLTILNLSKIASVLPTEVDIQLAARSLERSLRFAPSTMRASPISSPCVTSSLQPLIGSGCTMSTLREWPLTGQTVVIQAHRPNVDSTSPTLSHDLSVQIFPGHGSCQARLQLSSTVLVGHHGLTSAGRSHTVRDANVLPDRDPVQQGMGDYDSVDNLEGLSRLDISLQWVTGHPG